MNRRDLALAIVAALLLPVFPAWAQDPVPATQPEAAAVDESHAERKAGDDRHADEAEAEISAGRADVRAMTDRMQKFQRRLNEPISVTWEQVPLADVLARLGKEQDLNIAVSWTLLEELGVRPDRLVTLTVEDMRTIDVLEAVLKVAADAAPRAAGRDRIDYALEHGIVRISTVGDLRQATRVNIYDVRDLVAGLGGAATPGEELAELMEVVANLANERDAPGAISQSQHLNGNLIVKTTPDGHEAVRQALADVRAAVSQQHQREQAEAAAAEW